VAIVLIPAVLRPFTDGRARVAVTARSVDAALEALGAAYPQAGERLRHALARRYVVVSVDGVDVRERDERAALGDDQEIHLLWAVAGG
jgi:molybdopterin converting factor small subunit